jgi:hypothetical protein
MSLKSKEKSVADTGADEHLVALPNRSARREERISGTYKNALNPRKREKLRQSREIRLPTTLRMGITLRNGRSKGGKQRSKAPMMSAPEVVSTDGDTSISPRAGGAIGSVFLKCVWALLIHDQHDREARVWEEGAVEVLSECCNQRQKPLHHPSAGSGQARHGDTEKTIKIDELFWTSGTFGLFQCAVSLFQTLISPAAS